MNEIMDLTNRNKRVVHVYNGKSVTKAYYDRPEPIPVIYHMDTNSSIDMINNSTLHI